MNFIASRHLHSPFSTDSKKPDGGIRRAAQSLGEVMLSQFIRIQTVSIA
jgi:hypothetical protein